MRNFDPHSDSGSLKMRSKRNNRSNVTNLSDAAVISARFCPLTTNDF